MTPIGEVAEFQMGQAPHSSTYNSAGIGTPLIKAGDWGEFRPTPKTFTTNPLAFSKEGDVLICVVGATSGKVNLGLDAAITRSVAAISPFHQSLSQIFLFYFLKKEYGTLNKLAKGSAQGILSKKILYDQEIPLPPLPEQHRIVDKIEELFSELDNGVANLKKALAQLKIYRQAVLKAAFEGKLTEQWRKALSESARLQSAEALLGQIQAERQRQYEQQLAEWKKSVADWEAGGKQGRKPSKPVRPKAYPPLTEVELEGLPELPEGWMWVRLGMISDAIGGFAFKSKDFCENEGIFQVIKIGNVKMGHFSLENRPSFLGEVEDEINEKYGLKYGDCVITLTGTRKKRDYGYVAMVRNEPNLLLNQRLALVRFLKPIFPEYFQYALRGEHFQNNFFKHETGNVGQGNVSMKAITEETIALPPVPEQHQIVQAIESRLSVCDHLEQEIERALLQSEALRQSILKKAFEGRLAPQDPGDEPAGELLRRIKAEVGQGKQMKML